MKAISKYFSIAAPIGWTIACFIFFQWFYLYHLSYRLQLQLFMYSSDYLSSYFNNPAWLACMSGDFLTQFFFFNYAGPLTITIVLLLLGAGFFLALRKLGFNYFGHSTKNVMNVLISLLLISWEALRNCGINYELSSTLSLLGGILLFLPYAACSKHWRWVTGVLFLLLSYWLFGYGIWAFLLLAVIFEIKSSHYLLSLILSVVAIIIPSLLRQTYHLTNLQAYKYPTTSFFNTPNFINEKLLRLDAESTIGNWSKVVKLTEKDNLKLSYSSYFYNLSNAKQGLLPIQLMNGYQPGPFGLFISLNPSTPLLSIISSNEVWFQLGDMTLAEHSAILGLLFSPHHRSSRMTMRLAEINLINGDNEAAMKYLRMLQKTWLYKNWADARIPGKQDFRVKNWLELKQALISVKDTLRSASNETLTLRALVDNHRNNFMALDYLLCYDLLLKDIDAFMSDYDRYKAVDIDIPNRLYSEGLLIGLTKRNASIEELKKYKIQEQVYNEFNDYSRQYEENKGNGQNLQLQYGKTYWFYYHFATLHKS